MRLNQNQLNSYFQDKQQSLKYFYWLNSEDTFLLNNALKKIRKLANTNEFNERIVFHIDSSTDWEQIIANIQTPGLFCQKQIIELNFTTKINADQQKELIRISEQLDRLSTNSQNYTICIVVYPFRMDAKSLKLKWMNSLEQNGVIITIWPLSATEYPKWLQTECRRYKIHFESPKCFELLCHKTMGNPSAAAQTLFKLKLQDIESISLELLNAVLAEHASYTIFDFVDSYLLGNLKQCFKILNVLKKNNTAPLLIIWSLRKELLFLAEVFEKSQVENTNPKQILNSYKLWANKINLYTQAISKFNLKIIYQSLNKIISIEKTIKTENNELFTWQQIEAVLFLSNNITLLDGKHLIQ